MIQINKVEEFATGILQSQLSPFLTYHNYFHTQDVTHSAMDLAREEGVTNEEDLLLLKTAALLHDCGFKDAYENHEDAGCRLAKEILPGFGYSEDQIRTICGMIMKTKLPSNPETILEKILCDADLDYLGRDDFWGRGDKLYGELSTLKRVGSKEEWDQVQVRFLQSHHYWTKSANAKRANKKAEHLIELKAKVQS